MTELEDRLCGCLLGLCLGDALGAEVEGEDAPECAAYLEDLLDRGRIPDQVHNLGQGPFPFGQYTDDGQLARELLLSIVEAGGFDADAYAGRIAALFASGTVVGAGGATMAAARRLRSGVPWHEAGTAAPQAGNGSAMRVGPLGPLLRHDRAALLAAARDQGLCTHRDPRCVAGSIVVAVAAARASREPAAGPIELDIASWVDELAPLAAPHDRQLAAGLACLPHWLVDSPQQAAAEIAAWGVESPSVGTWSGISPFVTPTVLWSLHCFLRHPDDWTAAVGAAIAAGGDTDTTAAITGGLAGARLGLEGLPADLAARLEDHGRWGRDDLVDLARRAARAVGAVAP